MVSLADEIPMITKGESVLYKYAAGSDTMLLKYCDMLNIENQHLYNSNEELSHQVLCLETALETLESRVLHVGHWIEHCLSSHVHGDGSAENPFTLEGGDLRVSVMYDLTDPYPIEPVRVGGGVVCGQRAMCGRKRSDRISTKRLVPIEEKVFLKEEGYYTPPAAPLSPEPILVPGSSTLREVSKEEAERQVQEVAKFFEQLGGAPAIVAFTNGDWTDYVEEHFEEVGKGKGKERMGVTTDKAEKASEKISEMVE